MNWVGSEVWRCRKWGWLRCDGAENGNDLRCDGAGIKGDRRVSMCRNWCRSEVLRCKNWVRSEVYHTALLPRSCWLSKAFKLTLNLEEAADPWSSYSFFNNPGIAVVLQHTALPFVSNPEPHSFLLVCNTGELFPNTPSDLSHATGPVVSTATSQIQACCGIFDYYWWTERERIRRYRKQSLICHIWGSGCRCMHWPETEAKWSICWIVLAVPSNWSFYQIVREVCFIFHTYLSDFTAGVWSDLNGILMVRAG